MQASGNFDLALLHDRYQVQRQLGRKAGRRTLLALDQQTQELVVVKLLTFGDEFEWDDLKLFEREAATLQALFHPAIPRYLDHFEFDSPNSKGFALVQTYIDALSLEQHLQAGRSFSEAEVKQLAQELLEILAYLHDRQPAIIHRDIKPSNILLKNRSGNSPGEVYLVDFGSVQTLAAREGRTMTVVGTYGYMPPEQFGGRAGPASDLYSLGATLIYLVTGQHPADLPQIDLRIDFEAAAHISPSFAHWLRRMTEPSLNRRFQFAAEALKALKTAESTYAVIAPIVAKPADSRIQLRSDTTAWEAIIPPAGFTPAIVGMLAFAIPWNAFLVVWYGIALSMWSAWGLFMAVFAIGHLSVGLGFIAKILFALFGRVKLRVDQDTISLTYDLFGFEWQKPKPVSRHSIQKLVYQSRSYHKDSEGSQIEKPPQLSIWAGTKVYELKQEGSISEPELDWLAAELSQWLGLSIAPE